MFSIAGSDDTSKGQTSLSEGQANVLRKQYDYLSQYIKEERQQEWSNQKEAIITFCIKNNVVLYNVATLDLKDAIETLTYLLDLFAVSEDLLIDAELEAWKNQKESWKKNFNLKLESKAKDTCMLHHNAHLSIADQYQKTKQVSPESLLTFKDMTDLLNEAAFKSEQVLLSEPFSLTEIAESQEQQIKQLLEAEDNSEKIVFLPITHDGHWFYLLRKDDAWFIQDSQPIKNSEFSPRQLSIQKHCERFLSKLLGKNDTEPSFITTGEQVNDYDCGTRVTNAYRKIVDESYAVKSHREIIIEVAKKQMSPEIFEQFLQYFTGNAIETIDNEKLEKVVLSSREPDISQQKDRSSNKKGMFVNCYIPFKLVPRGTRDVADINAQAEKILAHVQKYYKQGYKQVGITYSANRDQTNIIRACYLAENYITKTSGGNQADVLAIVEALLQTKKYKHLLGIFRIVPISTCAHTNGVGSVKERARNNSYNFGFQPPIN